MDCLKVSTLRLFRIAQRTLLLLGGVSVMFVFAVAEDASTPAVASGPLKATHLLGLEAVKHNANGTLMISSDGLRFSSGSVNAQIATASIEGIFTGQDSRQTGGKALTVAKIAVPYGGGRVMSLFSHERFDSLTVEYRDSNGGLHAAIFRLPQGGASEAKKQLNRVGAKTGATAEETSVAGTNGVAKENK